MRRLLGRSKLKLSILLFLITISLLLGRLTISGLASYQPQLGQQRQNGRLPDNKLFDIPFDTIRLDQARDYGTEKLISSARTNETNDNVAGSLGAASLGAVTERKNDNAVEIIKTSSSKKIVQNDEINSDNTVTLADVPKVLNDRRSNSVNITFKIREEFKSSQRKVNALVLTPGNSSDVKQIHVDDVLDNGNVNRTISPRFDMTRNRVDPAGTDATHTLAPGNKKLSILSSDVNSVDQLGDEITSLAVLEPTTPGLLNPHSFQFIMDANDLCSRKDPPFLLVVVMSIHDHMDVRNAIRQTWGAVAKGGIWPGRTVDETVKLAFLLGLHQFPERESLLVAENEKYGDIIQENFVDSYYNLSIKMAMGLKWASQYCPGVSFILKADEDTFVNLPMLVEILRQPDTPRDTIIGRIMPESKVYRVGKWSVDRKAYAGKVYPPYAAGNTYVIPGSLARKLYKASERHLYIHVEDAFITGLLAQAIGASHLDMPGFTCQSDSPPQTCDFVLDLKISGTKANMGLMRHMWSQIKKLPTCDEWS